jgi:hypothetical protein
MRCSGGYVDGLSRFGDQFFISKGDLNFTLKDTEHLFEVMTVRRGTASGRDVHINQRIFSGRLLAGNEDGVGVAHEAKVRKCRVVVRPSDCQVSLQVV